MSRLTKCDKYPRQNIYGREQQSLSSGHLQHDEKDNSFEVMKGLLVALFFSVIFWGTILFFSLG
ncbi:hypothetical protein [Aestuariispira insulae]|uniref:Uncharacterized protein n=1 Tax=Aestuariispira insulae TaxID=1461337 RepID=A0A3D9H581_9PROT|nr:hypothetical protein [Aestuariispira insulae]RED44678.1 hypothetical protein DFP90_11440 [Aestuariispira insulae]